MYVINTRRIDPLFHAILYSFSRHGRAHLSGRADVSFSISLRIWQLECFLSKSDTSDFFLFSLCIAFLATTLSRRGWVPENVFCVQTIAHQSFLLTFLFGTFAGLFLFFVCFVHCFSQFVVVSELLSSTCACTFFGCKVTSKAIPPHSGWQPTIVFHLCVFFS